MSDELARGGVPRAHCDPEVLALRALGEPAGRPEDDAHLEVCAACRSELDSLRATAGVSRAAAGVALDSPSPDVWQRVAAEAGLSPGVVPRRTSEPVPALARRPVRDEEEAPRRLRAEPAAPPSRPSGPRRPPASAPAARAPQAAPRRRRVVPLVLATALVAAVAGVAGTVLVQRITDDPPQDTVVASTPLDPLPTWQADGSAEVVETPSGERELRLDLRVEAGPDGDDGFREVWLIDRDVSRLVSLGVLEGDSGSFVVPAGVDLAEYPVVDVSLEPFDGQPAHSGDSIARGILPT